MAGFFKKIGNCFWTMFHGFGGKERKELRDSVGILPDEKDLAASRKYKRVLFVGVDGAGGYFDCCDTPNFDRVFGTGAKTYRGISQYRTISAQNWTSMIHGVRYQKHHINNEIASRKAYADSEYPSVIRLAAETFPDSQYISVHTWTAINKGIVENMDCVTKFNGGELLKGESDESKIDTAVCDKVLSLLDTMDPKIAFVVFDYVDEMGHKWGYATPEFEKAVQLNDALLGRLYDAYVEKGWADDTLFVLASDHGHKFSCGHGGESDEERYVTIAVNGAKGDIICGEMGKAVTQDIASIILYGLGIRQPASYESRVPYGVFNTLPQQ